MRGKVPYRTDIALIRGRIQTSRFKPAFMAPSVASVKFLWYTPGMSPKKRAAKKAAKTNRAKKAPAKKLTLSKKSVAKKKVAAKKTTPPRGKKKPVHKIGRGATHGAKQTRDNRLKKTLPVGKLGEWTEDSGDEQDREPTLFEDEIPPDYGGSK
jgi:hypothetical protein